MGVVRFRPRPLYPRGKSLVPIELQTGWAAEPVWMEKNPYQELKIGGTARGVVTMVTELS